MALATIDDLKAIIRPWRGRLSIGLSASDTLTPTEAERFLTDAEAELALEYNQTPDSFTGYARSVFVKLECKMVVLSLMSFTGQKDENLITIKQEIEQLKKTLFPKHSASAVIANSSIEVPFYLRNI